MVYEELDKYLLTATWGEELDEYVKDQKLLQISAFYFQTLEKGDCTIFALSVLVGVTINYPSPRDQNKKKNKEQTSNKRFAQFTWFSILTTFLSKTLGT